MNINVKSKYNKGDLLYYCYIPSDGRVKKFPFVRIDIKFIETVSAELKGSDFIITFRLKSIMADGSPHKETYDILQSGEIDRAIKKKIIFTNIKDWQNEIIYKTNVIKDIFKEKRIEFLKDKLNKKFGDKDDEERTP